MYVSDHLFSSCARKRLAAWKCKVGSESETLLSSSVCVLLLRLRSETLLTWIY